MTKDIIISALDRLGIKHETRPNSKNWLGVVCPYHFDKDFGNAFVNLDTGHFKCFHGACNVKAHITGVVKHRLNCSWKEANKFLGNEYVPPSYDSNVDSRNQKPERRKKIHKTENTERKAERSRQYHLKLSPLNPYQYRYTLERGFTKEFVDFFQIQKCDKGSFCTVEYTDGTTYDFEVPFIDYFITPLASDMSKFEARRLKEFEVLNEMFPGDYSLEQLQDKLERYIVDKQIKYKAYKLYEGDTEIQDPNLVYLLQTKNFYSTNANVNSTIFNVGNLDLSEDLVVCEGIPGIPKVWAHWTKNVTAIFGAAVSAEQLEILMNFEGRIIVIPDNDHAGDVLIFTLYQYLKNVWVLPTSKDDTDMHYIRDFKLPLVRAVDFLKKKYNVRNYAFAKTPIRSQEED